MKDKSSGPGQGSALVSPENHGMHQEVMIPHSTQQEWDSYLPAAPRPDLL